MLESTDPELALLFKEMRDREVEDLKNSKKQVPLLNLQPLINKEYSYEEEGEA